MNVTLGGDDLEMWRWVYDVYDGKESGREEIWWGQSGKYPSKKSIGFMGVINSEVQTFISVPIVILS